MSRYILQVLCRPTVSDCGPTLNQPRVNIWCLVLHHLLSYYAIPFTCCQTWRTLNTTITPCQTPQPYTRPASLHRPCSPTHAKTWRHVTSSDNVTDGIRPQASVWCVKVKWATERVVSFCSSMSKWKWITYADDVQNGLKPHRNTALQQHSLWI